MSIYLNQTKASWNCIVRIAGQQITTVGWLFAIFIFCSLMNSSSNGQDAADPSDGDETTQQWKDTVDSIKSYEARMNLYRKHFDNAEGFDVESLIEELKKRMSPEECKTFLDEYFVEKEGAPKGIARPLWGDDVLIRSDPSRHFWLWTGDDGKKIELKMIEGPFGALRWVHLGPEMDQVQLEADTNYERFGIETILNQPAFFSGWKTEQEKLENGLESIVVPDKRRRYSALVDPSDGFVLEWTRQDGSLKTQHIGLYPRETPNLDIRHPTVVIEYRQSEKNGLITVLVIRELKINPKLTDEDFAFAVPGGIRVIDLRKGTEKPRLIPIRADVDDLVKHLLLDVEKR